MLFTIVTKLQLIHLICRYYFYINWSTWMLLKRNCLYDTCVLLHFIWQVSISFLWHRNLSVRFNRLIYIYHIILFYNTTYYIYEVKHTGKYDQFQKKLFYIASMYVSIWIVLLFMTENMSDNWTSRKMILKWWLLLKCPYLLWIRQLKFLNKIACH